MMIFKFAVSTFPVARTDDVRTTLLRVCFKALTSLQRPYNVVLTSWCWLGILIYILKYTRWDGKNELHPIIPYRTNADAFIYVMCNKLVRRKIRPTFFHKYMIVLFYSSAETSSTNEPKLDHPNPNNSETYSRASQERDNKYGAKSKGAPKWFKTGK